jgi:hypothetical protein
MPGRQTKFHQDTGSGTANNTKAKYFIPPGSHYGPLLASCSRSCYVLRRGFVRSVGHPKALQGRTKVGERTGICGRRGYQAGLPSGPKPGMERTGKWVRSYVDQGHGGARRWGKPVAVENVCSAIPVHICVWTGSWMGYLKWQAEQRRWTSPPIAGGSSRSDDRKHRRLHTCKAGRHTALQARSAKPSRRLRRAPRTCQGSIESRAKRRRSVPYLQG